MKYTILIFSIVIIVILSNLKKSKVEQSLSYTDIGNGTIISSENNLMWKKCSEGQDGNNCEKGQAKKFSLIESNKFYSNIDFASYNDWRLPTLEELHSLVLCTSSVSLEVAKMKSCSGGYRSVSQPITSPKRGESSISYDLNSYEQPTINKYVFPNIPAPVPIEEGERTEQIIYWASTFIFDDYKEAVNFSRGTHSNCSHDGEGYIRLVRTID